MTTNPTGLLIQGYPERVMVTMLTQALLREYMHKNGYTKTLANFDGEEPRTAETIDSRAKLTSILGLKPNGDYRTYMEILIQSRLELLLAQPPQAAVAAAEKTETKAAVSVSKKHNQQQQQNKHQTEPKVPVPTSPSLGPQPQTVQRSEGAAVVPSSSASALSPCVTPPSEEEPAPAPPTRAKSDGRGGAKAWDFSPPSLTPSSASANSQRDAVAQQIVTTPASKDPTENDVVAFTTEESDHDTEEDPSPKVAKPTTNFAPRSLAINPSVDPAEGMGLTTARALKRLLCGTRKWWSSWVEQGIFVNSEIAYGLVQRHGGPCGPLSVLNGFLLRELYFGKKAPLGIDVDSAHAALPAAMSAILTGIAQSAAIPGTTYTVEPPKQALPSDQVTEGLSQLRIRKFTSAVALTAYLKSHLEAYLAPAGNGLLLFLVSCVLTRVGAQGVTQGNLQPLIQDMDVAETTLIAEHGYSSQELVNLLLCGSAVSNTFDGVMTVGEKAEEMMQLQGIPRATEIGFLSYMEKRSNMQVGNYLKSPISPIWVVYCESHFTILFSQVPLTEQSVRKPFDVYYYDQLGSQEEEIRLTVDPWGTSPATVTVEDLIPPLDECIRTKWKLATINWNGTDPLL